MAKQGIAFVRALGLRVGGAAASVWQHRRGEPHSRDHAERGDVPGWVMITLMSAVLVAALLALAGPALEAMFTQAMDTVGK
ncbi:hypothetical protein [Arthrobacter sp. NPDC093139]|uniref:hypothetical protein n=1 Tax=Arthrobacter sp. NPDC093139 TaxID=3363945 RepID=UPI0038259F3F